MALAYTSIRTAKPTRVSGETICKMAQEKKNWRTDQNMTECLRMEKNGVKEHISGQMTPSTPETGWTITSKGRANTDGPMEEVTLDNGKRTSCMERASTLGLTDVNMRASTKMIRNMALDRTTGPMARHTRGSGSTENNTERPDSQIQKERANLASGKMENV